jgi:hypothetical protein
MEECVAGAAGPSSDEPTKEKFRRLIIAKEVSD